MNVPLFWVVTKSCCELDFDYPVVNIYSAIGESEILVILRHVQTTQSGAFTPPLPPPSLCCEFCYQVM